MISTIGTCQTLVQQKHPKLGNIPHFITAQQKKKQEHRMQDAQLSCSCWVEKSKKGHNLVKKNGQLPSLLVWVPLLTVNNYSDFQVNIFSNNRDIRKCQSFCAPPPTPGLWQYLDDFFENSRANQGHSLTYYFLLPFDIRDGSSHSRAS